MALACSLQTGLLLLATAALAAAAAPAAEAAAAVENGTGAGHEQTLTAAPLPAGSSEQDLLKWALSHSDPEELKLAAAEARAAADAGSPAFLERQARVQALVEALRVEPSEADLMREAVAILADAGSSRRQLEAALQALALLVEPIDLANDLRGMGGLAPLVALLQPRQPPELQGAAVAVLGTAASNNPPFQAALLEDHPESVALLLQLLPTPGSSGSEQQATPEAAAAAEAGAKALLCLSALLRLSAPARTAFYRAAGMHTLQALAGAPGAGGTRLQKRALGLLADLVALDARGAAAALDARAATAVALQLLQGPAAQEELDLCEKSLLLLLSLLESGGDGSHGGAAAAAATAKHLADAGGLAVLQCLEQGWRQAAAEAAGEGEDEAFLQELTALAHRAWRAADAARVEGAGPSLRAGRDASEL